MTRPPELREMVLLVDDDVNFQESAKKALGNEIFVLEAVSGRQALDLIKAIDFSVVLVDLDLSGQSGFDVIQIIHENRPKVPLIAISGVYSRATLESTKELGAAEVLQKPISPEWATVILRLLEESQ